MANTRAKSQPKILPSGKKKKCGPTSTDEVKKTKSMDEILGVEPLEFTDEEEEDPKLKDVFGVPLSPNSSLRFIQQQEEIKEDFAMFLEAN
uniref:Uncharacterized protein n=1 Tax=Cannabis sativa TaxID=3483 RepID=A0A803QH17_CANSA